MICLIVKWIDQNTKEKFTHLPPPQEIVLLTGGLSGSAVYKIVLNDQPYVLKLGSSSGCMEIAAKAGIVPPVYYINKVAGIAITGFIESAPQKAVLLPELAQTIRRIHELPPSPTEIV